jgi:hypothetical protein
MNLDAVAMAVAIATPLMVGLVWLIRAVSGVQREFRPNGGASARDLWNRTNDDVREIRARLDDHIANHGKE